RSSDRTWPATAPPGSAPPAARPATGSTPPPARRSSRSSGTSRAAPPSSSLAGTEEELAEWILRVDEIDPEECRREAARRFSPAVMADRYLELYERTIRRSRAVAR